MDLMTTPQMNYEFRFEPEKNFVSIRCYGTATAEGYAALGRDLLDHPLMQPGIDGLVDERELDLSDYSSEDLRANAALIRSQSADWGSGRWAYVVQFDVAFGMGRMWEAHTDDGIEARARTFRSIDDAREWLGL